MSLPEPFRAVGFRTPPRRGRFAVHSAPGRETADEPTAARKIAGLEAAVKDFMTDAGRNGRIDLTASRASATAPPPAIPSP